MSSAEVFVNVAGLGLRVHLFGSANQDRPGFVNLRVHQAPGREYSVAMNVEEARKILSVLSNAIASADLLVYRHGVGPRIRANCCDV